jgi:hypothetical protein
MGFDGGGRFVLGESRWGRTAWRVRRLSDWEPVAAGPFEGCRVQKLQDRLTCSRDLPLSALPPPEGR